MKNPILKRLFIAISVAPLFIIAAIGWVLGLLLVQLPYWIATGDDFTMDILFPFYSDIYERLYD